MSVKRLCDICNGNRNVSRFTMSHKTRTFEQEQYPERVSTISAGGIDMCSDCWTRIAKPRKGKGGHQHRYISKCDRCKETGDPLRYTLKVSVRRSDGKVVTKGAGGVVLCRLCWKKVGYTKMRKGRQDILRILNIDKEVP